MSAAREEVPGRRGYPGYMCALHDGSGTPGRPVEGASRLPGCSVSSNMAGKNIWLVVWNMFIFPYIENIYPNWLVFFRGVQTTNQTWFRADIPNLKPPLKHGISSPPCLMTGGYSYILYEMRSEKWSYQEFPDHIHTVQICTTYILDWGDPPIHT